ncbi:MULTISPECIES: Arc family DNA-binding protein [Pantoea]|uniref:Arc family DNA-binding protein n=1 Tax=Pantoea TaxID=53335 RepID=UPI0032092A66
MKGASQIAPFGLRMPEELKDAISKRAAENGRSMNAEIVQMLEDSLASDDRRSRGLDLTGVSENQMEYIIDTMTQKLVDKVGEALSAENKKPT